MHIPFVDLKAQYEALKDEMAEAIQGILDSAHFIGGEAVASFERDFAAYCQVRYARGVASGTDALHPAEHPVSICGHGVARRNVGIHSARGNSGTARRYRRPHARDVVVSNANYRRTRPLCVSTFAGCWMAL